MGPRFLRRLSKYYGTQLDAFTAGGEAGFDIRVSSGDSSRLYLGVAAGYVNAKDYMQSVNISGSAPTLGIYGTWLDDGGWFVDAAAKYFFYNFRVDNAVGPDSIQTDWNMAAASVEAGKEFKLPASQFSFFTIEPKIKGFYGNISDKLVGVTEFSSVNSFVARPAVFASYSTMLNNGAVIEPYVEGGCSYDFSPDMQYQDTTTGDSFKRKATGASLDIGGGVNVAVTNVISIYSYAGYEKGSNVEDYSASVGVRIALTGIERGLRFCKYKMPEEARLAASGSSAYNSIETAQTSAGGNNASASVSANSNAGGMQNSGAIAAEAVSGKTAETGSSNSPASGSQNTAGGSPSSNSGIADSNSSSGATAGAGTAGTTAGSETGTGSSNSSASSSKNISGNSQPSNSGNGNPGITGASTSGRTSDSVNSSNPSAASSANTAGNSSGNSNTANSSASSPGTAASDNSNNNSTIGTANGGSNSNAVSSSKTTNAKAGNTSAATHYVHFEFGKYAVSSDYANYLEAKAKTIIDSKYNYEIDGHTDRIGSYGYNKTLSVNRAKAVYDKLIELGVPAEKLTYKGFSWTRPLNPARTKEAYAENRRVEINPVK